MRTAAVLALLLAVACHEKTSGDAVRAAYEERAQAVERQAATQPTPTARKIWQARAAAIREEGHDREKGLEGGTPSAGPGLTTSGG